MAGIDLEPLTIDILSLGLIDMTVAEFGGWRKHSSVGQSSTLSIKQRRHIEAVQTHMGKQAVGGHSRRHICGGVTQEETCVQRTVTQ